jgi:hypothetical protein
MLEVSRRFHPEVENPAGWARTVAADVVEEVVAGAERRAIIEEHTESVRLERAENLFIVEREKESGYRPPIWRAQLPGHAVPDTEHVNPRTGELTPDIKPPRLVQHEPR